MRRIRAISSRTMPLSPAAAGPSGASEGKRSNLDSTVHANSSANPDARVIKRNGLFRCSSRFLFTLLIISLRGPLSPPPFAHSISKTHPILRYLIADNTCKDFYLSTDVRPCARENKKHLRGGFCNGGQIPDMNGSPVKFEAARCRVADQPVHLWPTPHQLVLSARRERTVQTR